MVAPNVLLCSPLSFNEGAELANVDNRSSELLTGYVKG